MKIPGIPNSVRYLLKESSVTLLACFLSVILFLPLESFSQSSIIISTPGATGSPDTALVIHSGNPVTFHAVSNSGCPPKYQWQLNGTDIPGATRSGFTAHNLSAGDRISCRLVPVTGTCPPATSNQILVTVAKPAVNARNESVGCTIPVVTVKADYCAYAGKVLLKATSSISGSYTWSTGETTSSILVDIVGVYTVSVKTAGGCTGSGSIRVGSELVINGDFEGGNSGFTSPVLNGEQYQYQADISGNSELNPEGLYGVGPNAQTYHSNFWGYDHSTGNGTGKYMIVNGFPNGIPQPIVWQETVKVIPNVAYYFSAWGKSLNNVTPYAQLQFNVNGQQIGTAPVLPAGVDKTSNSNWSQFYGTLTTGPNDTTAVISITDLQNATGGNDFGLDDISFGTLWTFIKLESAPGTDSQTVCINTPLTNIVYSVGSTDSVPVITGLPAGLTTSFDGIYFTISGSPSVAGVFPYTISTSGTCNRTSASGTITVVQQSISLNSVNSSPTVCANTPVNIGYTISGTAISASATGLPAGVSLSTSGNAININGTPTVTGSFPYTLTTSGSCAQATASGTITVNPYQTISTIAANTTLCPQPFIPLSTSFSVAVDSSASVRWWENNGSGWSQLSDGANYSGVTTQELSINNITETMEGYQYRTSLSDSSVCYVANSTTDTLTITHVWKGATSSDWSDQSNWWGNVVPDLNCQYVIIPKVSPGTYPVLTGTQSEEVRNLVIRKDASVTVADSSTLRVRGAIYSDMSDSDFGYLDGTDGQIELNGGSAHSYPGTDTAQVISGSLFKNRTLMDLKISNPLSVTVKSTPNDTLNVTGTLSFGPVDHTVLNTGDNITLVSVATGTARVADITNNLSNTGNAFNGKVIVERYINTGTGPGQHGKAWEFLAVPAKGQTVKESWMENGASGASGFGTQITGAGGTAAGYDLRSAAPSMKFYNPNIASGWQGIDSPGISLYNPHGYMLFVRGDRSIPGPFTPAIPTRLRTKGILLTDTVTVPVESGVFTSVGNPFASAIDMEKVLGQSSNVDPFFTVWRSASDGIYGYGAYITYSISGSSFVSTPGGVVNNNIESGQAFFVKSTSGGGNLLFTEPVKAGGSTIESFRIKEPTSKSAQLRTNLYRISPAGASLADGTLHEFRDDYNPAIDRNDAVKIFNGAENLVIPIRNQSLIIERTKPPEEKDTLFFKLTGLAIQKYRFEFVAGNMSMTQLQGFVEDSYLHSRTPLNMEDTTILDFEVNHDKGSSAPDRFRIVFKALPVTISLNANPEDRNIRVNWKVVHERNMRQYEVQRSVDGINFTTEETIVAAGSGTSNYHWLDMNLLPATYYYRVMGMDQQGKIQYTEMVKVLVGNGKSELKISPNPVGDGVIHLYMLNMAAGKYSVRLLNNLGQVIYSKQIDHHSGSSVETIGPGQSAATGMYPLQVTLPDGEVKILKVMFSNRFL